MRVQNSVPVAPCMPVAVAVGVAVRPVLMTVAHPPAVAMVMMMVVVAVPVPAMPVMMMAVTMPGLLDHAVLNRGRRRGLWQSWGCGCRRERCAGDEE